MVRLLHPDKALDGAAVDHDLPVQGPLRLRGGDGHVFQLPKEVRELHTDELDVFILDEAEVVLPAVDSHSALLLIGLILRREKEQGRPRRGRPCSLWVDYREWAASCQWGQGIFVKKLR